MKKVIVLILLAAFLTGCASKTRQEIFAEKQERFQLQIKTYKIICESHGLEFGSQGFADCMMTLRNEENREQSKTLDRQNNLDRIRTSRPPFKLETPNIAETYRRGLSGYGNNSTTCTTRSNGSTGALARIITDCN